MQSFKFCHKEKTNLLQIRYQILLCRQVKKCVIMQTFLPNRLRFEYVNIIGLYTNSNRQIFPLKTKRAYRCRFNCPKQPNGRTTYKHNISYLVLISTWGLNTILAKIQKLFSFTYRHFYRKNDKDGNFLVLFFNFLHRRLC